MDLLSDALNAVKVAELKGKSVCTMRNSKLVSAVLSCLKDNNYLGAIETSPDGKLKVTLKGSVNNCGAVRPRFFVKCDEWEKYETRFLPSRSIGLIIVSTSSGIMTHAQAKEKRVGGKLLAFVY
ncbi:MAG: 30S ribosomal protein S8 [Candidatus Micrarchaeota archaeon]|nr:30S ribosomal protein S8 [Candidatus Micrarchaeota archaeon]